MIVGDIVEIDGREGRVISIHGVEPARNQREIELFGLACAPTTQTIRASDAETGGLDCPR
jgi:hypothetical protein